MSQPSASSVPAPVVALITWLVPGSGYWLIGQRARALTVGITIIALFILGMWIGGIKVVDKPDQLLTTPVAAIVQKPWFIGQIMAGPITLIASSIGKSEENFASHARINEIGTLYTAVAGMLNLLAIIDSAYRAARQGSPA